jgi:phosphotransferase system  glucose/maltose/N-acetylglucosamine-specific IIC component
MLTQVSFLLSVSNNVPELRKSLETTKATLSPSIVSTFSYSSFFVVVFVSLKFKFKNGKQNKNKKKKKKKKKKKQTKIKRHTKKTLRGARLRD